MTNRVRNKARLLKGGFQSPAHPPPRPPTPACPSLAWPPPTWRPVRLPSQPPAPPAALLPCCPAASPPATCGPARPHSHRHPACCPPWGPPPAAFPVSVRWRRAFGRDGWLCFGHWPEIGSSVKASRGPQSKGMREREGERPPMTPTSWQYAAVSRPRALGRQLCLGKRVVSNASTL